MTLYHLESYNRLLPSLCVLDTLRIVVNYYRLPQYDKVVSEGMSLAPIITVSGKDTLPKSSQETTKLRIWMVNQIGPLTPP